jgi:uncharacterized protein (DUF983 family)
MLKSTKLYSVTTNKCPRCHQGNFFASNNAYNLKTFHVMNTTCTVCAQDFKQEPGFYYGAMYASYGLTVGIAAVLALIMNVLKIYTPFAFIASFAVLITLIFPLVYRYSRLSYINVFVHYKPQTTTTANSI